MKNKNIKIENTLKAKKRNKRRGKAKRFGYPEHYLDMFKDCDSHMRDIRCE